MSTIQQNAMREFVSIQSNKQTGRLGGKTQVSFPVIDGREIVRNRLTHSYEVVSSGQLMSASIDALKGWQPGSTDYKGAVASACLLHDYGHGPLAHSSKPVLNNTFINLGVAEGFCDNANTLVIIEKNKIVLSNYTLCSVIKYPEKLYDYQKLVYLPKLEKAIAEDVEHFKKLGINLKNQKTTIACQIMDQADTATYVCSDLSDFFCLGNELPTKAIHEAADRADVAYRFSEMNMLFTVINSGDKSSIRSYFNSLRIRFNENYTITDDGVTVIDTDLEAYREFLWDIELNYYIAQNRTSKDHLENMEDLQGYIALALNGFTPSRYYSKKISEAKSDIEKYRYIRDMIAETTDHYMRRIMREQNQKGVTNHDLT